VLASGRLEKLACPARETGVVEDPVIRIVAHLLSVVEGANVRLRVPLRAEIQKQVGLGKQEQHQELLEQREKRPDNRHEKHGACSHETKEEDDDKRMLVVHEVVAQTDAAVRDAAIRELEVEPAEGGWGVHENEAVEKANGCVSVGD